MTPFATVTNQSGEGRALTAPHCQRYQSGAIRAQATYSKRPACVFFCLHRYPRPFRSLERTNATVIRRTHALLSGRLANPIHLFLGDVDWNAVRPRLLRLSYT